MNERDTKIQMIQKCVTLIRHSNFDDPTVAAKIYDILNPIVEAESQTTPGA